MLKGLSERKERERREETRERKRRGAAVFPTLSQQLGYFRCSWLLLGRGSGRLGRAIHTPALLPLLVFPGAPLHVWVCMCVCWHAPTLFLVFPGAPLQAQVCWGPNKLRLCSPSSDRRGFCFSKRPKRKQRQGANPGSVY